MRLTVPSQLFVEDQPVSSVACPIITLGMDVGKDSITIATLPE